MCQCGGITIAGACHATFADHHQLEVIDRLPRKEDILTGHDLEGRRILVVEDSLIQAMEITESLCAVGAVVLGPTPEAAEAELILDKDTVDCAVVDIDLGNGPSYELAEYLKRRRLPFLFSSGFSETAVPESYKDVPVLLKPYSGEALVKAVENLIQTIPTAAGSGF
jgi:DNA-binding NarL/FixJ family response regulator